MSDVNLKFHKFLNYLKKMQPTLIRRRLIQLRYKCAYNIGPIIIGPI